MKAKPTLQTLLGLLLVVSGALGLGYQVLWSKFLLEFIGVSAYSYAIVLAAFMTGMAIGSAAFGTLADRVRSPLKLYACLELGIGLYAIAYPSLTDFSAGVYAAWVHGSASSHTVLARILLSGSLLLPPTALMGGTIPALLRFAVRTQATLGRRASQLYAANALGAVSGALAMAFVVMPGLGLRGSLMLLALGNLAVAGGALVLDGSRIARDRGLGDTARTADRDSHGGLPTESGPPPPLAASSPPARPPFRLPLLLVAVAGILSFALEIGWTRFFAIVLGSSTYSFALMLAAFITGIALGSAALAHFERAVRQPLVCFGIAQAIAGGLVLVSLPLYQYMPWLVDWVGALFSNDPLAFYLKSAAELGLCYSLMLPPTVFIGMSIPLVITGVATGIARVGSDAGRVFAANTIGNVLGALGAGLVLLPLLGVELLLRGTALAMALLGAVVVGSFAPADRRRWIGLLGGATIVALAVTLAAPWNPAWFSLLAGRRAGRPTYADSARLVARRQLLYFADDPAANLLVIRIADDDAVTLLVNGKADASSGTDMRTQMLLGHLPLLLNPAAKEVMVIGLASGVTAGAVLRHDVDRVEIVDIVGRMPEASRYFEQWNHRPLADPRTHLIVDDARSYALHTDRRYDVIISEPSNPWVAGIGSLFSRDFYAKAVRLLKPGGLYLQWIQAYEISDSTLATLLRGFRRSFPAVYGFESATGDLLLVGALLPLAPDWREVATTMRDPGIAADLHLAGVHDVGGLLLLQQLSPSAVDWIAAETDVDNTDDNLFLEYRAPRDLFEDQHPSRLNELDARLRAGPGMLLMDYLAAEPESQRKPPLAVDPTRFEGAVGAALSETTDRLAGRTSRAERIAEVTERLVSGGTEAIAEFHDRHNASIRLEALLEPTAGKEWLAGLESAFARIPGGQVPAKTLALWIDLLAATGQVEQAKRELRTRFIGELAADPETILRACNLDRGDYCDQAISRSAPAPDSALGRLQSVRSWTRPPTKR